MAIAAGTAELLAAKYRDLLPHLDERQRRLVAGADARMLGYGGIRVVARAAGMREGTVSAGVAELDEEPLGRVRRSGGGRKRAAEADPGLVPALLALVEPGQRGDPESPLRWTVKSTRKLAAELTARGHKVSADTVGELLRGQGFSLQGNAKTIEGRQHPDRDAQFRYINEQARVHRDAGDPVISVDTKKKEQVGQFANAGREWRPAGDPVAVADHDFPGKDQQKAIPYGIYDIAANAGWVSVGTDHDTAAFAVESVRRWWHAAGQAGYPGRGRLLITADAGGPDGYRTRAWKAGLADLARETGLEITCCHFPPGTSKWNQIEHRLFSAITMNWRGRPLTSHEVIVNTIAATTTATGLRVHAELDPGSYPEGVKISDQQMAALPLHRHDWHGDWNYALHPAPAAPRPAQPPAPPAPGARHDLLTHPALTGLPRHQLDDLAAALTLPWNARQEARRYARRGGPRRNKPGSGPRRRLGLTGQLAVTLIHQHLSLPRYVIARLAGTHPSTISQAITDIAPLLPPGRPAPIPLHTTAALIRHAATAGITLPPELLRSAS